MKVALVHDWLNYKIGGGEQFLFELARLYPEAPIYTLIYDKARFDPYLKDRQIHTSYLNRLPGWLKQRSRYLLPLIPVAVEQFDFKGYDVVISSSSAFVKNVITPPETLHLCYCHSPMRFAWDHWPAYLQEQRVGPLRKAAIHYSVSRLRQWDYYGAARVDYWVANSRTVAKRLAKYYRVQAKVIYPPTDLRAFKPIPVEDKEDYYLVLSSLTPYKQIDLAIQAANNSGRRLIVVGDGPDRRRLERLAGPTVELTGRVSDTKRAQYLARARALIFPGEEDFGLAPIEAMASGTPVVAYGRGGLTETVIEGESGLFFSEPSPAALNDTLNRFEKTSFDQAKLTKQAAQFGRESFDHRFTNVVKEAYQRYVHPDRLA